MRPRIVIGSAVISTLALFAACGGSSGGSAPPEYPPTPNGETTVTVEHDDTPPVPPPDQPPPPPPVQVVAGENTPIEGTLPSLQIQAPRNMAKIARAPVSVRANLRNWSLAPDPGNHVHFIVDNEPYIAVRDLSHPVDLAALVHDNLGHDLAPGTHVLRMFPSRPQHESVKDVHAFAVVQFVYQTPTDGFTFDAHAPMLTYSRPKGCNVSGSRVLLDFFLANVPALSADGFRVHYTIDGSTTGDIASWVPHFIENLPDGEHTVQLTLLGADGNPVAGPFNDTTRTITVAAECPNPHASMPEMHGDGTHEGDVTAGGVVSH